MDFQSAYVFHSPRYNLNPPGDAADPNDVPLGQDLAQELVRGLAVEGIETKKSSPLMEDSYWLIQLVCGGVPFEVYVHWAPLRGSSEDWWVVRFFPDKKELKKHPEGVLSSCLGLRQAIAAVLAEDEFLAHPKWMTESEFEDIY